MQTILAIDIGSTNLKCVLLDPKGRVIYLGKRPSMPDYLADKQVEMDAGKLSTQLMALLKETHTFVAEEDLELIAISVTAQRSSVVPVDAAGQPLTPIIMWHDKRTAALCQELRHHDDRVYALSGMTISPVYSAVKMLWFKRHRPEIYRRAAKMLGIQDFVLHCLCGRFVTDHSLASSTNLLNLHTCQWDPELLEIFEIKPRHLCDLVPPGSICGTTTKQLAKLTGIPAGIPVVSAGGDQQCGALGQGVFTRGKIKCTTGTGSYLLAFADAPVIDEQKRFVCKVGAIPETYCLEAGIFTTGTVYRWFVQQFYPERGDEFSYRDINREVQQSPPGANGVVVLPHFEGSGAPHWNPADTGVFYNINLATTRADMARAILEAIAMETRDNIRLFEQYLGTAQRISVAGGLTQFPFYNQLQADIFASPVATFANTEATALGAFLSAAVTCSLFPSYEAAFQTAQPARETQVFTPDKAQSEFYEDISHNRHALYQTLQSLQT